MTLDTKRVTFCVSLRRDPPVSRRHAQAGPGVVRRHDPPDQGGHRGPLRPHPTGGAQVLGCPRRARLDLVDPGHPAPGLEGPGEPLLDLELEKK